MKIFRFDMIDSTNKYLKEKKCIENFDCVIAKNQTAGVGRRGNTWSSSEGAALFSFALRTEGKLNFDYIKLPLIVGMATLSAIKKIEQIDLKFKWTNDIYCLDKKMCGILVEKIGEYFIIGIGINLNNEIPPELGEIATSLNKITNKKYIVEDVIFAVINEIKLYVDFFNNGNWQLILDEINQHNYLKNKEIIIEKCGKIVASGVASDINDDGQLRVLIEMEDGTSKTELFNIGEIHIKR